MLLSNGLCLEGAVELLLKSAAVDRYFHELLEVDVNMVALRWPFLVERGFAKRMRWW